MIIVGNKPTYQFEQNGKRIHLPRIYINDIHEVRNLLSLLQKHRLLTNLTMTEETTRVRSENAREFFQLMWDLGLGIDVTRDGKSPAFVANSLLEKILKLDDSSLKNLVLEKLLNFNPFVAMLDKLIEYKVKSKKFTQQNITDDFHESKNKGNLDNTHPLLRWANDDDWKLVDPIKKEITKNGINFVSNAKKLRIFYVNYDVDLNQNENWNVVTHVLSKASFKNKNKLYFKDILEVIKNNDVVEIDENNIESILQELKEKGLPIYIHSKSVIINNKIFHSITPKSYIKFGLEKIDGIALPKINSSRGEKIIPDNNIEILIIEDDYKNLNLKNYPENSLVLTYDQFLQIENDLPSLNIKTIILPSFWKPLKVMKIIGILLSFVRFGGNLIIEDINTPGRIGSNPNRYVWLPYDLTRISSVTIADDPLVKGYFTFNDEEKFSFTEKGIFQELEKDSGRYSLLYTRYNSGQIIFITLKEEKDILDSITKSTKKIQIDTNSVQWTEKNILSLRNLPEVNVERDLYPILKKKMNKYFGFEFDPEITGKAGQTDLMIEKPFFCCCEVSTFLANATGGEKVGEVHRHRSTAINKDRKKIKRKYVTDEIGACVLGPSFTLEDGYDKYGAVESADALNVSLLTYIDLYELLCLNEKVKLTSIDFKKIFFYQKDKPIASERIYNLIKEKKYEM